MELIRRIWNSPTLMTWGGYVILPLRLLLVTPLLLTRFSDMELAAWYLFASVSFFGMIVSQRFGMTFSRMFSFAMGGASGLAPITKLSRDSTNGKEPDWIAFERAYATLGILGVGAAAANLVVSGTMGWVGLRGLVGDRGDIWIAFAVFLVSDFICFTYRRYSVALIGMNYVALEARWSMIFNLFSVAVGAVTLMLGGNVLELAVAMQAVALIAPLRQRFLLSLVEQGRVLEFKQYKFDWVAFQWAWPATYKGFLGEMGMMGGMQLAAVIFANCAASNAVASYLFAMRILDVIVNAGQVPFTAIQPALSRQLVSGQVAELKSMLKSRFRMTWGLTAAALLGAGIVLPGALSLIGSKTNFVSADVWFVFGLVTLLSRFLVLNSSICSLGNDYPFFREMSVSCLLTLGLAVGLGEKLGVFGPFLAASMPPLLLLNVRPIKRAGDLLEMPWRTFLTIDFMQIFVAFAALSTAAMLLHMR